MKKVTKRVIQIVATLIMLAQGTCGFSMIFRTGKFDVPIISLGIALLGMIILGLWWVWFCAPDADNE